jgi:gamma-glutamyltranspeptidase/glutathione hydrolase
MTGWRRVDRSNRSLAGIAAKAVDRYRGTDRRYRPAQQENVLSLQPMTTGARYMIVAGHYLATEAGHAVLQAGGNAIDAGVAAGIALSVLQSEQVQFAGVAPIVIHLADRDETVTISGVGWWPRATQPDRFADGLIPMGILRTVVPAAPDAWLLALERYGTMRFADVASTAVRYAREGFPADPMMVHLITKHADYYRQWPQNAAIYLPNDEPPKVGQLFVQQDLARTIQFMIDEENAAGSKGRKAGLAAARNAFYLGDLARTIAAYHRDHGGWLTLDDLASYHSEIEPAVRGSFGDIEVMGCGPWCQGPVLLQMLKVLENVDLRSLGHNSHRYIHVVTEAMKLCFADRDRYYGDPRFVNVPLGTLLSSDYAAARCREIDADRAYPGMPAAGSVQAETSFSSGERRPLRSDVRPEHNELPRDTSYVGVIDRHGNAFSAAPSDVSWESPVIPGLGICPSARGSQSWARLSHPASALPGKRPRLTPSPAIAMKRGTLLMPFGAPGGDQQAQSMLQVFLNHFVFGMGIQDAVEAARFVTHSFPGSFEPHPYYARRLDLERDIGEAVGESLSALGHEINWLPERSINTAGVCAIVADRQAQVLYGGADPRRSGRAMGW